MKQFPWPYKAIVILILTACFFQAWYQIKGNKTPPAVSQSVELGEFTEVLVNNNNNTPFTIIKRF